MQGFLITATWETCFGYQSCVALGVDPSCPQMLTMHI